MIEDGVTAGIFRKTDADLMARLLINSVIAIVYTSRPSASAEKMLDEIMAIENENKYPRIQVLFRIIRILQISANTIFYPEIQRTEREKEQLMHMIQLCGEKEVKIAAAS